ncbi:hypothetical protein ACFOSC_08070 [Streptantibioticus rubrisoli]|uniref:Uncharacterized protein n=1 Tax=Streptantibioticus rubrisoli TaxID=1387313 RepID=A0ABT1P7F9_9ACTN|nr:hypothetical protein [Streptantibioticus rubrisoli]MCQ4041316.1 hypothetical protein [Streptantibioticus rubrisoli]
MTAPTLTAGRDPRFDHARRVADAVLYEGCALSPCRAWPARDQRHWQFGALVPPACGTRGAEHTYQRTECLLEPRRGATLSLELRFLHAQRGTVQRLAADGQFEATGSLDAGDRVYVPWDEGVEERVELTLPVAELAGDGVSLPFTRPAQQQTETVSVEGRTVGRLVRNRERVDGVLRLSTAELDGPYAVSRLTAVVENTTDWPSDGTAAQHADALPRSLVSAHLLLGLSGGSFLSMTDPPEWARTAAASCHNEHTWPVLAGEHGRADVLLSAPIVLEDHPRIAPDSPGTPHDGTGTDETATPRAAAPNDQHQREARGTDERAGPVRALREGTGTAAQPDTPWWDPAGDTTVDPDHDRIVVDGREVGAGSRVRLRPGRRRTDAQDVFVLGRTARVEAVLHDVDGLVHLAVTVDGDPGADLRREEGRFWYFQPDEVEPLGEP